MIRIIAGKWRGTHLNTLGGHQTRPTADRTRQAIFNVLEHNSNFLNPRAEGSLWSGLAVFDGFAGSGAFGLECLSRGAAKAYFSEQNPDAIHIIRQNIKRLSFNDRAEMMVGNLLQIKTRPQNNVLPTANLVFLDPPYHQNLITPALENLEQQGWLAKDYRGIFEMAIDETFPSLPSFHIWQERHYGKSKVIFGWRLTG